jgi:DNA-binding transcriptional ArsR family regulator
MLVGAKLHIRAPVDSSVRDPKLDSIGGTRLQILHSLADPTRRDILERLSRTEDTVRELAAPYAMSLAAIAKHVSVLEKAGLVTKRRSGKEKIVRIAPNTIKTAAEHLSQYERLWAARFDALEKMLSKDKD